MAATSSPLTCKQCGYANEGERVYCHNCGTKLDRTLLPTNPEPEETLAKKQKRIKKIVNPMRGFFAGAWKTFGFTMLWSLLSAAAILTAMPPDNIPKEKKREDLVEVRDIGRDLEDGIQSNAPASVTMTEDEINDYLQYKGKPAPSSWLGDSAKFERAFVNLDEGMIRITSQQIVFGHPFYSSIYYRLGIKNNKLETIVKGGNFGRLRIHPNLMKTLDSFFQNVWEAFKRDKKSLDHCQSVDVHKGHVDVVTLPET